MKPAQAVRVPFMFISLFLIFSSRWSVAQIKNKQGKDSVVFRNTLSEVVVRAFEQTKKITDQPAAVSYISSAALDRYGGINILDAMNAVPGVRMEQRSPGSYRLNIRGSSLRSPFGVRNVKIYYNGMPFTDPGGNTYLNQLAFDDFGTVGIIKGPAGSLYGAGMGGVVLVKSPLFIDTAYQQNKVRLNRVTGSFGLQKWGISVRWGKKENASALRYSDMKREGYRDHTALHHRTASYETRLALTNKEQLAAFFHYTDLYYQTPGALTYAQFEKDPKAARPASGRFPSAKENKTAVHQKAFYVGIRHNYYFAPGFENSTVLYGAYTDFINPAIRNYEFRKEPHAGGRTVFQYHHDGEKVQSRFWLGAELQQGYFSQKDFQNKSGTPDTLMTADRMNEFTALLFAQARWTFQNNWELNAGMSFNHQKLRFTRLYPEPLSVFNKKSRAILAPRVALSKKISSYVLLYADVSRGFSPPAVAELLPSTGVLNKKLQAEQGINYELGSKGYLFQHKLYYDISTFIMRLTQTISLRRDSSGADYFVNAGSALQKGLEISLTYAAYHNNNTFLRDIDTWLSQTVFDFKYKDYRSADKNYSGNKFPGTAPYTLAAGVDLKTKAGLNAQVTWQHTSKIPLNDANEVYASAYDLLGIHFSYHRKWGKRIGWSLTAGGNNLLNEKYSLGNDINAVGGRYYNVAPAVHFYGSCSLKYFLNK